ncbi:hypothetical protein LTR86_011241 [Recurvomyces mirabilis]|nr:hypothetical protein LTR86_011241 [Recurvomyces mirabilis]
MPHEKSDPLVVQRLRSTLKPPRDINMIEQLHQDDEVTKWFGVTRDATGRPILQEFDRFTAIMSHAETRREFQTCYPQLVSFIGTTNAGKSTLVKMLVEYGAGDVPSGEFPSPVVGSIAHDSEPTSGDVHLYADPSTCERQHPILYADCEGLEGGERLPMGSRPRRRTRGISGEDDPRPGPSSRMHAIEWAENEDCRRREFAVATLYPRLLYTFSDCVVFVLRNAKTFQSAVLTRLLDWGVAALERSINQPSLPQCIVVLNGCDPSIDSREWDLDYATQSLLATVGGALDYVEGVPRFRELANQWRARGRHIYTVEDLILRYYSSLRVVRVPVGPNYTLMDDQIGKLQRAIRSGCEGSFRSKRQARMLTNADELYAYLQCGFQHFTAHLDLPFNFMQASLLRNPIPNDFGGHILELCTIIYRRHGDRSAQSLVWMFEKLSVMLASCILLDIARFRKGTIGDLFPNYEQFFDRAVNDFQDLHLPCAYVSRGDSRTCALVRSRHQQKGHQDHAGIFAEGEYVSPLAFDFMPRWKDQLSASIESLRLEFAYDHEQVSTLLHDDISDATIALDLHLTHLQHFFGLVGPAGLIRSHATCFCCLMNVPEHPLPCGHVLCDTCIHAWGKQSKSTIEVQCCPLHQFETGWMTPAVIHFTPPGANARVLVLDGGGIRGIIQLEILRAIEHTMGHGIPIQAFFDLMVGTGTGGWIVTKMALRDHSVQRCLDEFKAMCEHVFTPRSNVSAKIARFAQVMRRKPCYRTKHLYSSLRSSFDETDNLFGPGDRLRPGMKVALTTSSGTGRDTILLASYRRPEDVQSAYAFRRPHEPEAELKIWQCVAAAMANPSYFLPLHFQGKAFLDGGLSDPNPVCIADHEARLLWSGEPDLVLSLGTGQDRAAMSSRLSQHQKASDSEEKTSISSRTPTDKKAMPWEKWLSRRPDGVFEAELAWYEYNPQPSPATNVRRKFRVSPNLGPDVPAQDSKCDLHRIQRLVRDGLAEPHQRAALSHLGRRMIATSFYFVYCDHESDETGEQVVSGEIDCRLLKGSQEMQALGRFLAARKTVDFTPYFEITPSTDNMGVTHRITLSEEIVQSMVGSGVFQQPKVRFRRWNGGSVTTISLFISANDGLEPKGLAISGFPRRIVESHTTDTFRARRSTIDRRKSTAPISEYTVRPTKWSDKVPPVDSHLRSHHSYGSWPSPTNSDCLSIEADELDVDPWHGSDISPISMHNPRDEGGRSSLSVDTTLYDPSETPISPLNLRKRPKPSPGDKDGPWTGQIPARNGDASGIRPTDSYRPVTRQPSAETIVLPPSADIDYSRRPLPPLPHQKQTNRAPPPPYVSEEETSDTRESLLIYLAKQPVEERRRSKDHESANTVLYKAT